MRRPCEIPPAGNRLRANRLTWQRYTKGALILSLPVLAGDEPFEAAADQFLNILAQHDGPHRQAGGEGIPVETGNADIPEMLRMVARAPWGNLILRIRR